MSDQTAAVADILLAREPAYSQNGQRLNSRDAAMQRHLQHVPQNDDSNAMAQDLNPANINNLLRERDRFKQGSTQWNILNAEFERIKDMASNLLGPVKPEPIPGMQPSPIQNLPYNRQENGAPFWTPSTPQRRLKYPY